MIIFSIVLMKLLLVLIFFLYLIFYLLSGSIICSIILCCLYIRSSIEIIIFYNDYNNKIELNKISTIIKTDTPDICNICQEDIIEGLKLKCNCKYIYHADCLIDWFKRSLSCPLCRQEFIT